ncbi:MAG: hypothetical protein CVV49_16455 [Spirochaetae bacterium HGW-Spirochaetae-5]|nr:MAG: hypothetical protein CVV49_16455 [Spirochaetae bacterium HGW-Spirochaetae-5]
MEKKKIKKLEDFCRILQDAKMAGFSSMNDILCCIEEGELKSLMTRYLYDNNMTHEMLLSFIKNTGQEQPKTTVDFTERIRASMETVEKLELLLGGQNRSNEKSERASFL